LFLGGGKNIFQNDDHGEGMLEMGEMFIFKLMKI
jgi:hypothetical protein